MFRKRFLPWSLLLVMCLVIGTPGAADQSATPAHSESGMLALAPITIGSPTTPSAAAAEPAPTGPILRILKRRQAGLTVANVVRVLQQMKAEGQLAQFKNPTPTGGIEVDVSSLAVAVANRLAAENPQGWEDIDWDQVLLWIEQIIQMILKYLPIIIDLFSQSVSAAPIAIAHSVYLAPLALAA